MNYTHTNFGVYVLPCSTKALVNKTSF